MQALFQKIGSKSRYALGFEPEVKNNNKTYVDMNNINEWQPNCNPIKGLVHKPDGSRADIEQDLPVLADCQVAWDYLKDCLKLLSDNNSYINTDCSVHMHVSTLPIRPDLTNEQFTLKSIDLKNRYSGLGHYLSDRSNLDALFDTRPSVQLPLDVVKDVGYRISKHIDFFGSTIARSRRDAYFCKYPASHIAIKSGPATLQHLSRLFKGNGSVEKYSAISVKHYSTKKTLEFRSHSGTMEYRKLITWSRFITNIIDHSLQNRFKANTVQEQLTSPSYIGRSANTIKSRLWDFCRVEGGRSTQDIMAHCNISCANSVRRTIAEIRQNENYEPFVVTHNQQEYGTRYGTSDNYSNNGYEILTSVNVNRPSNNITFINNNEERGSSSLIENLDQQTLADLQERIRQLN